MNRKNSSAKIHKHTAGAVANLEMALGYKLPSRRKVYPVSIEGTHIGWVISNPHGKSSGRVWSAYSTNPKNRGFMPGFRTRKEAAAALVF